MNQDTSKYAHSEEAKHIIKQNEFFHEENRKLRDEIADQKNQYDTLENEVESREKQVTYMRGLLKNFIAISEKEKDLSDCKENKIKMEVKLSQLRRSNHWILLQTIWLQFISIALSVFFARFTHFMSPLNVLTTLFAINAITTKLADKKNRGFLEKEIKLHEELTVFQKKNNVLVNEIVDIRKACDFLNEYVDAL